MELSSTDLSKKGVIWGAAFFNDAVDGKHYDTGTIFVEESLDQSKDNAFGKRTVEYPTVDSVLVKKLQKIKDRCPFEAEIIFSMKTTKRAQKLIITDFKPLDLNPKKT